MGIWCERSVIKKCSRILFCYWGPILGSLSVWFRQIFGNMTQLTAAFCSETLRGRTLTSRSVSWDMRQRTWDLRDEKAEAEGFQCTSYMDILSMSQVKIRHRDIQGWFSANSDPVAWKADLLQVAYFFYWFWGWFSLSSRHAWMHRRSLGRQLLKATR